MKVQIRLFARAKDLAGVGLISLEVPPGIRVRELRSHLVEACPALAGLLPRCALAINNEFAADEMRLPSEAEIALLPPVSGG